MHCNQESFETLDMMVTNDCATNDVMLIYNQIGEIHLVMQHCCR